MMTTTYDEEDNSNAGGDLQKYTTDDPGRKRKAADQEMEDDETSEREIRRKRNREAAKKCREKKVQETENLKKKNDELQKENCDLVKQRNDLMQRCISLEEALHRHKEQGCIISESSPLSSDLSNILDPNIPPSPSFARSPTPTSSPCPSPVASVSPVPVATSIPQTYKVDPLPVRQVCGAETTALGGQRSVVTHPNSKVSNSQTTWTRTREMRVEPATSAPSTSQPAEGQAVQECAPQLSAYCVPFKDTNGCVKKLYLSHEEYTEIVENFKKSASVNQDFQRSDVSTAVYASSSSQPQQVVSASQVPKQEVLPKLVSTVGQRVDSPAKPSLQSYQESDMLSINPLMTFYTDMEEEDKEIDDFLLVNPNDILMETEFDENNFELFEEDPEAVQHKAADVEVEDIFRKESDTKMSSNQQMFTMKINKSDTNALTNPVSQSYQLFRIETDSKLAEQDNSSDGNTVTDPRTSQMQEQDSAQYRFAFGELPHLGPLRDPTKRQTVLYTSSAADAATLCLGSTTDSTTPVLLHADKPQVFLKPVISFPTKTEFGEVSDQQPFYDTITAMKTVKLRPKATQLMTPASSSRGSPMVSTKRTASAQSSQKRVTLTGATDGLGPLKGFQIIDPSAKAAFQKVALGLLPSDLSNIARNDGGLQLQVSQQQALPTFQTPRSRASRPQATQSLALKGQPPVQEDDAAKGVLETNSTRFIREYLQFNSIEIMDNA